jgi:hypothetical protein
MIVGTAQSAPMYFKEMDHRCPVDSDNGFMQYAFQTKLASFEFFSTMPDVFNDFNTFVGSTMGARNYWVNWFPIQERLIQGSTKESPLLVDVGAGKGHDLLDFHSKFPQEGHLVLQDLAGLIDNLEDLDPAIEPMVYDFSTEQPVKGM